MQLDTSFFQTDRDKILEMKKNPTFALEVFKVWGGEREHRLLNII